MGIGICRAQECTISVRGDDNRSIDFEMRFVYDTIRSTKGLVVIQSDTLAKYRSGRFKIYFTNSLVKKAYVVPDDLLKERSLQEYCEVKMFILKRRAIR
jgi:hypothetical protein